MSRFSRSGLARGVAVLSLAGPSSLLLYHLASGVAAGGAGEGLVPPTLRETLGAAVGSQPYSLTRLFLLKRAMDRVDESYVDPSRVSWDDMYDAALNQVERRVPEALFRREPKGSVLHVTIGSFVTSVGVGEIKTKGQFMQETARVAALLQTHLSDEVPFPEVEYALINGALSTLDPHSILLEPEDSREMEVENSGEFGGLGITIVMREGRLTVEYPLEETPAWKAGVQPDDRIVRINGESTLNMDINEAVSRLRGKVGDPVTVTIERDGWKEPKDFVIIRDKIKMNPVIGELLAGGVGYVRINNFHAVVSTDLATLLDQLRVKNNNQELRGLVLDLRGNPGGYLHQAIEVSDMFLSSGTIVSTVERFNRRVDSKSATSAGTEANYPMVVLVNTNSASASEIVAGALRNNGRAAVVGERTFGKGSVQNLYPNNEDDSQLKLTVARYLTPGDQSIQSVGVPPDVLLEQSIVETHTDKETNKTDPVVTLFWRERLTREADLDHHLGDALPPADAPVYAVRTLNHLDVEENTRRDRRDLSKDNEVQLCRELILAAPPKANRAELLAAAGKVVTTTQRAQSDEIKAAFQSFGIDWTAGDQPAQPQLTVSLDLGPDAVLLAGEAQEELIYVKVTNNGPAPVFQVMAIADSTASWLDGGEFFFGRIDPGQTKVWPKRVQLPEGYRDSVEQVTFKLQDGQRRVLGEEDELVRTVGQLLPRLSYAWSATDAPAVKGTKGDGDGVIEPGETIALRIDVTNNGPGPTDEAFARVKNRAGTAIDLKVGLAELGVIPPGEKRTAELLFEVKGAAPMLELELTVGDQDRYDHAAVWLGGFYDYATQTIDLKLPISQPLRATTLAPPTLSVTNSPPLYVGDAEVVLSGLAEDDVGLRDVIIYQAWEDGEEKLFYQGGGTSLRSLPWTVDATLKEGRNLFVVLTRDDMGLTDIRSVSVWYDPDAAQGASPQASLTQPLGGWPATSALR
ncbi:MAG: PDZ domain-containing protein [Deltaproteobacteria bacterium]|nr:PDZ domain-containing protein [Deltaproteobacteria bacterium]